MEYDMVVDFLTREALKLCSLQDITIERPLMHFMVKSLLISKIEQDLMNADEETKLDIHQSIYDQIIENGPVIQLFKLTYLFKKYSFKQEAVQEKYEKITKDKLMPLLDSICKSNGNSKKNHEELIKKITTYIVASTKIFSPRNAEMLDTAKAALESILTKQDLLDFVSRKKHYQVDYLQRLGKIMCGILLFNKHTGIGGEAIRDVVDDVQMAYKNTLEALRLNIKTCNKFIILGLRAVSNTVTVNLLESKLVYRLPHGIFIGDLELFNKFNYLYIQHEIYLQQLMKHVIGLKNMIDHNAGQLKEVIFQLHDVVKFRLAVPSESVFPLFSKLFETWYQILMQIYFLVDVNKVNDEMTDIVSTEFPYEDMALKIGTIGPVETYSVAIENLADMEEQEPTLRIKTKGGALLKNDIHGYCALTMTLSNGILVQSDTTYGVLPFKQKFIGFKRKDYISFAEKNYNHLVKSFLITALQNPEMSVLFNIPTDQSIQSHFTNYGRKSQKTSTTKTSCSVGNQTEHCVPPSTLEFQNSYSWNLWEYHRKAIQLANLKKSRTHPTQTDLTYSTRDAAVQTFQKNSK